MEKIAIGTMSELKVRALQTALMQLAVTAETIPVKTESGVPDQPFGYEEITRGAKNRAQTALEETDADVSLGVESGIIDIEGRHFDIACVFVITKNGIESVSYSSGYFTPQWIVDEIRETGTEYGHITQRLSGGSEKDPLNHFSEGAISRAEILSQAIAIALVKILNEDNYKKP